MPNKNFMPLFTTQDKEDASSNWELPRNGRRSFTNLVPASADEVNRKGNTQCSKIGKKCTFKSAKNIICIFKNGKKSIFTPEKSPKIAFLVVLNFFLVQKLIFCHF